MKSFNVNKGNSFGAIVAKSIRFTRLSSGRCGSCHGAGAVEGFSRDEGITGELTGPMRCVACSYADKRGRGPARYKNFTNGEVQHNFERTTFLALKFRFAR